MDSQILIKNLDFLTFKEKENLSSLKIKTLEELLYYFPFRFLEAPTNKRIDDLKVGENVSVSGVVVDIESKKTYSKNTAFTKVTINDDTESLEVFWWNMPYISKSLKVDQRVVLTGIIAERNGKIYLSNPRIEKVKNLSLEVDGTLFEKKLTEPMSGVYYENKNIKSLQLRKIIEKCLKSTQFKKIRNLIPKEISIRLSLPERQNAIIRRHLPVSTDDVIATNKYFAFEEIFVMQLYREHEKALRKDEHAYKVLEDSIKQGEYYELLKNILPFKFTDGQEKILETVLGDMREDRPMSRLVEGDVGSGKTAIAFAAAVAAIFSKSKTTRKVLQVACIAPTEILANQHFEFFTKTLSSEKYFGIALLTSKGAKIWPSKADREKWVDVPKSRVKKLLDNGQIHIVIGTHALFNKNVKFENLALIILDEQHRFGVKQRMALIENNKNNKVVKAKNDLREIQLEKPIPHLLSMSATPIPRTLALTIYGDLDLSILDELPPGRKRATTKIINKFDREKMYEKLFEQVKLGRQAYIIAPRIAHNEETSNKSSVEYEEKRIKEKFPNLKIGVLHGKDKNKETTIAKFYNKEIDILISTTVVEVGISVANATVIVIENAETFGLAQLHQLRGRVERSSEESFCFLACDSINESSLKRLTALEKSNNGFELAEVDLADRGAGSLIGNRQSGLTDIGMEAIKNRKLVETAKSEAQNLLKEDPSLSKYPNLKNKIESFSFHEE